MANAYWKVGDTRPAVLITLNLGTDPETGEQRFLQTGDVVSQIMRRGADPAITRTLTIVDPTQNRVLYKPAAGDFANAGDYIVEFEIEDDNGDVETVPDRTSANYTYTIGAKVG